MRVAITQKLLAHYDACDNKYCPDKRHCIRKREKPIHRYAVHNITEKRDGDDLVVSAKPNNGEDSYGECKEKRKSTDRDDQKNRAKKAKRHMPHYTDTDQSSKSEPYIIGSI